VDHFHQVLRRLKKAAPDIQQDSKRQEDSDHCSVPSARTSQKILNSTSSEDEREDMVPISWRIKRRQMETERHETSHSVQPNLYPSSTSSSSREEFINSTRDAGTEVRPKRVKIRLPSSASRQIEQRSSSWQRFARDDKSHGCPRTF
jgi:hypothetical protein